jgi:hypothetical protein
MTPMFLRLKKRFDFEMAHREMRRLHPTLHADITKLVGVMRDGYQILRIPMKKNLDLLRYLQRYAPRSVVEFGSGTTTATFNYFSGQSGCSVVTLESHSGWYDLLKSQLSFGPDYDYRLASVRQEGGGSRFDVDPPFAEFLYVDGPAVDQSQPFNVDAIALLRRGARPKAIVFDVRYDTARATHEYVATNGLPYRLIMAQSFPPAPGLRHSDSRHSILEHIRV